jgi:hypothetical protein
MRNCDKFSLKGIAYITRTIRWTTPVIPFAKETLENTRKKNNVAHRNRRSGLMIHKKKQLLHTADHNATYSRLKDYEPQCYIQ